MPQPACPAGGIGEFGFVGGDSVAELREGAVPSATEQEGWGSLRSTHPAWPFQSLAPSGTQRRCRQTVPTSRPASKKTVVAGSGTDTGPSV